MLDTHISLQSCSEAKSLESIENKIIAGDFYSNLHQDSCWKRTASEESKRFVKLAARKMKTA